MTSNDVPISSLQNLIDVGNHMGFIPHLGEADILIDGKSTPVFTLEWREGEGRMVGYAGFCVIFNFDLSGNFINAGIWE